MSLIFSNDRKEFIEGRVDTQQQEMSAKNEFIAIFTLRLVLLLRFLQKNIIRNEMSFI